MILILNFECHVASAHESVSACSNFGGYTEVGDLPLALNIGLGFVLQFYSRREREHIVNPDRDNRKVLSNAPDVHAWIRSQTRIALLAEFGVEFYVPLSAGLLKAVQCFD